MSLVQSYAEILEQIDVIDPVAYAQTRNHLSGAVTRLSPYISRGVITLPQIKARLLARHQPADCAKLLQELAWREYFQNVWWATSDAIFADLRFSRTDWRHQELVSAVVGAETGIVVLDEAIKNLYNQGYIHNHARLWIASVACNIAQAHWFPMGKWLYYHLADGDLASNFLSWQWVAGTSSAKRYTTSQSLLNACSDIQQFDTWLPFDRNDSLQLPLPPELQMSESFAYDTNYPAVPAIETVLGAEVYLYTPWTLDPSWRRADACGGTNSLHPSARRILIIDPVWFDRFPVSDLVLDFIMRQGQTVISELEIFIGEAEALPGLADAASVYCKAHPTNTNWPAMFDARELLAPACTGYYPSFFKYWQQAETAVLT